MALLTHMNTPGPDTGMNPAEVFCGRSIQDMMPILPRKFKPQEGWIPSQEDREKAVWVRYMKGGSEHKGTTNVARRWDRSDIVLDELKFDQ